MVVGWWWEKLEVEGCRDESDGKWYEKLKYKVHTCSDYMEYTRVFLFSNFVGS